MDILYSSIIRYLIQELDDQECYHGNILEDEVKGILPRKGDFILRTQSKDVRI